MVAVVALLCAAAALLLVFFRSRRQQNRAQSNSEPTMQHISPFLTPGHSVEDWRHDVNAHTGDPSMSGNSSNPVSGATPVIMPEKLRSTSTHSTARQGAVGDTHTDTIDITTAMASPVSTSASGMMARTPTTATGRTHTSSRSHAAGQMQAVDVDHIIELIAQRIDPAPRFAGADPPPSYPVP